jgi:hypothetical protein
MKINDKSCILEKSRHLLDFQDFPIAFLSNTHPDSYIDKVLSVSSPMEPWWLRCFSYQNQLYFLSLKTGKIVYRLQVDEYNTTLRAVGPSNSVLVNF